MEETPQQYFDRIRKMSKKMAEKWAELENITLNKNKMDSLTSTFHLMHHEGFKESHNNLSSLVNNIDKTLKGKKT